MINLFAAIETIQSTVCFSIATPFSGECFLTILIFGGLLLLLGHIFVQDNVQTLPQNATLFSAFMDNLPAFAWIKDLEGRYVYVNKLVIERLAPFENDWLGKTDAELWPSEIAETYVANDLKVISSGETLEMVETCLLKGEQRYLLVTKFPIFDETGAITMIGATGADITALKDTERAVLHAKKKFHDIFENAVEGIFQTTPDGRFITANPALARILGYDSPEELLSNRTDIAREQYVDPARRTEFKRLLAKNGVVHEFEHEAYRKDGSRIWLSENVRAVCDADGAILYYEGFTEDITARKGAQNEKERLLANERKLRLEALVTRDANLALTKDLSLERVLETSLEYLRKLVPYDSANVMLVADDSKFVVSAIRGYETFVSDLKVVKALKFDPKVNALFNQICSSRRSLLVPDSEREPSWQRLPGAEHARSWIGVPLIAYGKTIGLYSLDKAEPDYFTSEHVRLAESLAAPAASAIENARLFQRGKEHARELEQRIAERERAQEALKESESFRRTIIDSEPECVKLVAPDCTLLDINPAGLSMIGADSKEQVIGQSVLSLIAPEWQESFLEMHEKVCQGASMVSEFEIISLNGVRRRMETHAAPLRNFDGGIVAQLAITHDVTQRHSAEESLKLFRNLIDRSTDSIEVVDPTTLRFLDCNTTAHESLGYTREEFLSLTAYDIDPVIDQCRVANLAEEMTRSDSVTFESVHRRKDGSTFPVEINAKTIRLDRDYGVAVIRDITERKVIEEKLRQSESQLAEAQRLASVGSWSWDLRANTVSWSDELYRIFGMERKELHVGQEAMEMIHCQDRELIKRAIENSLQTKEPYNLHYRIRRPDSVERIVYTRGQVVSDEQGTPIRVFGATQDVTEREQAEEALRRAEQNYRDIFENAGEGIFQTTPEGTYIAANPALARMYGFESPEELICSRTDISRELYVDPERWLEFKRLLETNGIVRGFEHQIFRKDGSKIWVTVNARVVRDQQGQVLYYEGTTQDITERKQAEAALRDSEERYRTLFENAKDAYYVHDLSGRYISVNRAAEKLSGHSREDIIGRRFTDFVPPEQIEFVTEKLCGKLVSEGETTYETEVVASDGRRVPVEVSSHLIVEKGVGVCVQGAARDITERKRAEEGLRQSEREYRGLFENAHDAILIIHPEQGIVLEVNQRACEIYGICRSDFIGLALQTLSLDPERSRSRMQETLKRNTFYNFETIHKRGDGTEMFLDIHASMVQYKGQPAIQSINRDITERKLSEKRLREYEKAVEGLEEMIVVVDRDYKYQLANKEFLRYRQTERDRLIGRPVAEFLGEAVFNQIIKQKLDACFQGNIVKYEMSHDYPNLGERNLAVSYFPIEGPGGIDRAACVLRDVTDLKHAEQALIQSEERFSKAFHSSPVALTIGALEDGRVLEINAAFTRMTGYTREESVGHTTVELGLWLGGCRQAMTEALRNHGAVDNLDVQFRKKSGEIRDGLLSAELIHLDAGPCILGIAQDVTERNRAERALQNYPRQLIEAQEAERQSIARELHDQIGQVLTAIHLNLEAIRNTGSSSEATALIDEGVIIVDEALEQVRKLSFDLRPSLLDDLGLISALRWYADRFQQRTGITATVNISLPRNITRLRHELETACFRIVQEALTNVARHANAKNVSTELEVFGDETRVCIKDDGVGFDTEAQNLAYLTTHLGLRGMRERALAVGGSFEIISSPLHGTEIRAVFPCEG